MDPISALKTASAASGGQLGMRPRLDVVAARPPAEPAANDTSAPVPQPQENWLSEQDFMRTLELVDRACHDLKASEERVRKLEADHERLLEHAAKKFEEAQELIHLAEERAEFAEQWARSLEERTARAEARAAEAEERANAQEEWLARIKRSIERVGTR